MSVCVISNWVGGSSLACEDDKVRENLVVTQRRLAELISIKRRTCREKNSAPFGKQSMGKNGDTWLQMEKKGPAKTVLALISLFLAAFVCSYWIDNLKPFLNFKTRNSYGGRNLWSDSKKVGFQLDCSTVNETESCPALISPVTFQTREDDQNSSCPEYFRWIHEDLRPWKVKGITREMVERGKRNADFRLVIVNGRVYIEKYRKVFQTRDVFTVWGIVQLLRKYPGKLPDLDLMFNCDDRPAIRSSDFHQPNATAPPPLFHYCGNAWSMAIVFPDWSFWGWPEINIKPWEVLLKELKEANEKTKWIQRKPYAFWKGNPSTSKSREDLMKCNPTDQLDWKVQAFAQDWKRERQQGFKESDLSKQCTHRYRIYVEGRGWSVSQKYVLACDSVTLFVEPQYHDFTTRILMPMYHYWPIRGDDICREIKFAVDWGNIYKEEAQAIGRAASNFIQEELKMDYVYDYMFNLLNEYAKLLKYKPTIPEGAIEYCSEVMACPADGLEKKFMMDSIVKSPADASPCTLPSPFDPLAKQAFLKEKEDTLKQVKAMENKS